MVDPCSSFEDHHFLDDGLCRNCRRANASHIGAGGLEFEATEPDADAIRRTVARASNHPGLIRQKPEYGIFDNIYQKFLRGVGLGVKLFCLPCFDCVCQDQSPICRIQQGSVGILLEFGRVKRVLQPGTYTLNIGSEVALIVSLRTQSLLLSKQEAVTKDTLTVACDAVVFYTVEDPIRAVFEVEDFNVAIQNLATVSLRTTIGENDLEGLFSKRSVINERLRNLLDVKTTNWGIRVDSVDLRDLTIPPNLQRAMASIAEATRAAEAKVIAANGQLRAASVLKEAAETMGKEPGSMQLQWFEILRELSSNNRMSTIVLPDSVRTFAFSSGGAGAG